MWEWDGNLSQIECEKNSYHSNHVSITLLYILDIDQGAVSAFPEITLLFRSVISHTLDQEAKPNKCHI